MNDNTGIKRTLDPDVLNNLEQRMKDDFAFIFADPTIIELSARDYQLFVNTLERPPKLCPSLKRLLQEPSVLEK